MIFTGLYGAMWYYYALDFITLIILIPAIILAILAQARVSSTFKKYSKIQSSYGLTGAEVARKILNQAGIKGVQVVPIKGNLTDNYNPKTGILSLSESVFSQSTVAAIGVAAHEAGHAIQYHQGYLPIKLRSILVPITNIGSRLALPIALIGVLIEWLGAQAGMFGTALIAIGILAYALSSIFSLVTLPVELNASSRAKKLLLSTGILNEKETRLAGKVLNAAALTYVASLAVSLAYLLRFILIISHFRRRD